MNERIGWRHFCAHGHSPQVVKLDMDADAKYVEKEP